MKALIYCHMYPGAGYMAGGETTIHDLGTALVRDGWQVDVCLSEPLETCTNGYTVDGVNVHAYTDVKQINRMAPNYNVLISHLGGAQRASLVARQAKIPSVQIIHNNLDITKNIAKIANYVVYNTDWVLKSFRDTRSVRPPGMVVHPPVNPAKYEVRSSRKYITLVNLADGDGGPYDKGPKTFYQLAERFPEEQFLGVVGGYGHQDVREMKNVTIVPNTEDIRSVYRKTKIVVSPSNYESFGRIAVEAAASGIPSLTSTAPGFREHNISFRCIDFRDVDSWEANLRLLLVPRTYREVSKETKLKVHELWQKSELELKEFCSEMRLLVKNYRR